MTKPRRVLFVCTGNSCRSVMAQGLLQQRLKQLEPQLREPVEVSSAGVFAIEGMSPSRETLKLLQQDGIDLSGHMARGLNEELARQADLILAMEPFQRLEILQRVPQAKGKVHLLKTFGLPDGDKMVDVSIPDPIGKPLEVYEVCFAMIREAVGRLAQSLVSSQQPS